jgi:hypothetical protein
MIFKNIEFNAMSGDMSAYHLVLMRNHLGSDTGFFSRYIRFCFKILTGKLLVLERNLWEALGVDRRKVLEWTL